ERRRYLVPANGTELRRQHRLPGVAGADPRRRQTAQRLHRAGTAPPPPRVQGQERPVTHIGNEKTALTGRFFMSTKGWFMSSCMTIPYLMVTRRRIVSLR